MPPPVPADDVERRKQVRLRLRGDLGITPQKYEGKTFYVVKDPVSLRYYRFKEQEHFIVRMMDGEHTLDETQKAYEKRFRPERLTLEDLEQFSQQLLHAGLVQNESAGAGKLLYDRRKKRRRTELLQTFTNILYVRIPVFDPDRLLTRMLPWFRWMFTIWFLLFSIGVVLGALFLVLSHFQTFYSRLPSYHEFFSFKTIIYMWAALGVVKVIHEFGHGLSCKAFGGEVHEMGFLFLCFSPAMYCNVSDAWTMPNKWHRIIIGGAGIYVELMIAAIATFVWWNTPSQPFLNNLSLSLMLICSVSTIIFNGNPLMRFDGYYVLADWLEIPNLRERSNRYIKKIVMDHCLGIESRPEPYMQLSRRILFVTYAVVSYIYRWVITFVILRVISTFLGPKLQVLGNLLALAALASMFGWPIVRLVQGIQKRGRLPDMKTPRVVTSSVVLAVLLGLFFFLPLPVSRIRERGVVQIQPQQFAPVHVHVTGILTRLHVREGEHVKKDHILAEFINTDLENRLGAIKASLETQNKMIAFLEVQLNNVRDPKVVNRLQPALHKARDDKIAAGKALRQLEDQLERLVLRAPMDGVVMNLPLPDEIGRYWEPDQGTPFCTVGDPAKLRVLVPVTPADFDLLRDNWEKKRQGEQLEVTIRVQGLGNKTWPGMVVDMPGSEAREIPLTLSTRGGGPLAIKPNSDPKQLQPQAQVYLVGINFTEIDYAVSPGALAHVKIHCEYRSCAWFCWRWLSQTFNLGLL